MDGRPFKITAILTLINETGITNLANIMSSYFIPIVPLVPLKLSEQRHIKSLYNYYDNVITSFAKNYERIWFLLESVEKFNVNLISIFRSTKEGDVMQEINIFLTEQELL